MDRKAIEDQRELLGDLPEAHLRAQADDGIEGIETEEEASLVPRGTDADVWWRRFNGARALVWIGVTLAAYFFGWIYSVAFVAVCSLYANVASDTAAWRADVNPQLDKIEERLERIEALLEGRK